jgi:hypothetical protein
MEANHPAYEVRMGSDAPWMPVTGLLPGFTPTMGDALAQALKLAGEKFGKAQARDAEGLVFTIQDMEIAWTRGDHAWLKEV